MGRILYNELIVPTIAAASALGFIYLVAVAVS